jgi:hypothetical protein
MFFKRRALRVGEDQLGGSKMTGGLYIHGARCHRPSFPQQLLDSGHAIRHHQVIITIELMALSNEFYWDSIIFKVYG